MKASIQLKKNYTLAIFAVLIVISMVLLIASTSLLAGRHKLDFTFNHRFTMKAPSEEIVKSISAPINITVYLSEAINDDYPVLNFHTQYIMRLFEKYQSYAPDKIKIEIKNPEPYSTIEKEAMDNNIRAFPNAAGDGNMFFGATFIKNNGEKYTIPYFSIYRQNYAEYDISRALAKLSNFKKSTVGLTSFNTKVNDSWLFVKQLKNDYNVINVSNESVEIPFNVDVLIVINPQNLNTNFTYALDQYILRGGKLILMVDPASSVAGRNTPGSLLYSNKTPEFLKNLGLDFDDKLVVGDRELSQKVKKNDKKQRNFDLLFDINQQYINQDTPFTKDLLKLSFLSPGALNITPQNEVTYTPLFTTSQQSGSVNSDLAKFGSREAITNAFNQENKTYTLGYFIEGNFDSLYKKENPYETSPLQYKMLPFLITSIQKSQIMVIADSDFIADDSWNDVQYAPDATPYDIVPSNNNSDFLMRSVDYMSGNPNLIGLEPSFLYSGERVFSEQLYNQVFKKYAEPYRQTEDKLIKAENTLNTYMNDLSSQSVTLSINSIKQVEAYKRNIAELQNELKHLDYQLKIGQTKAANHIIIINTLFFPLLVILVIFALAKLYRHRQKKLAERLINE